MTDHPRIRGEHNRRPHRTRHRRGSSPHTRGALGRRAGSGCRRRIIPAYAGSTQQNYSKLFTSPDHPRIRGEHVGDGAVHLHLEGIIPAYAGSTDPNRSFGEKMADHPRIRGEHTLHPQWVTDLAGSSPHTRGAQRPRRKFTVHCGIIPAYAGSTIRAVAPVTVGQDHPRIRGEHERTMYCSPRDSGSSPHTRGAPGYLHLRRQARRIIPAYAGSTRTSPSATSSWQDHPRIRGEHGDVLPLAVRCAGSSPHTRGAPQHGLDLAVPIGIIPAYAGSTSSYPTCELPRTDHPRIRGEHDPSSGMSLQQMGSSPHTRGAPPHPPRRSRRARIIPAYAGSTASPAPALSPSTDHPRIRGEHRLQGMPVHPDQGSSPHTRGARFRPRGDRRCHGIIPAYAGSTRCRP